MLNWLRGTGVGTRAAIGAGGGAAVGAASWALGDSNASLGKRVFGGAIAGAALGTAGHYGYENREWLKGLSGEAKTGASSAIKKGKEMAAPVVEKSKDAMSNAVTKIKETGNNVKNGVNKATAKMTSNQSVNYNLNAGAETMPSRRRGGGDEWGLSRLVRRSNAPISL